MESFCKKSPTCSKWIPNNELLKYASPWSQHFVVWVNEGIGVDAKSASGNNSLDETHLCCLSMSTWRSRPEPSSGRRPWRWPRCPPWSPSPSGRSSGWPLRRASPTFPWSFQSWRLDLDLSSDPGSVQMENASQNKNFTFHSCPFACSRVLCFWSDDVNWCDEKQ